MNTWYVGSKKVKEILDMGGPMVSPHVRCDEQLILWACSQAITQVSSGKPIPAILILNSVVDALISTFVHISEDPDVSVLYSSDYPKAKEHLSDCMLSVFFGAGGTTGSVRDIVDF